MGAKCTISYGATGTEHTSAKRFSNRMNAKKYGEKLKESTGTHYRVICIKPKRPRRDKKTGRWK